MDKLKMQTVNKADENFKKLAAMFPNAVTETIDENGEIVRAIDKDVLMQEISCKVVDGNEERYQFTWPDKKKSVLLANAPINKTLRPVRDDETTPTGVDSDGKPYCSSGSVDFDNTENLYIEGDNLEVLKLLQETYLGKIKMIYIDPPYNTGNDFVYADDFSQSTEEYLENSGQFDDEGNRLVKNLDNNGRFHTDWLNMLYPRLKLAKNLLTKDGVIFISIDENEVANLRKICDEIFGEKNFISNFIWQSRTSISNDYEVSLNHNHILVYSKNRENIIFGGDSIDESDYINPDNDERGPWKLVPIDANHIGGNTVYPITNPKTGIDYYPPNGRIWCYNKETMNKLVKDGRIKFGINDESSPKRKLFLNERIEKGDKKTPSSLILDAGTTKDGTVEIMNLFEGEKVFDYPKSVELLKRLIKYGAPNGGIILDFFAGSSTTAQAVIELKKEMNNNLSFIMVQIPENLDESLLKCTTSSKKTIENAIRYLDKIQKPHYITKLSEERIRKVIQRNLFEDGFRIYEVTSSNMKDVYYTPTDLKQSQLNMFESNIKEDRTAEDLLTQVILDLGLTLDLKIEERKILNNNVYFVESNSLVACFDDKIDINIIDEICKCNPLKIVFKESSFKTDSDKINTFERIKKLLPETEINII